jgi:hypothetical protein
VSLRLTKQQREYQEAVLIQHDLDGEYGPNRCLVDHLAFGLRNLRGMYSKLQGELQAERAKSIWTRVKEGITR